MNHGRLTDRDGDSVKVITQQTGRVYVVIVDRFGEEQVVSLDVAQATVLARCLEAAVRVADQEDEEV